MFQDWDLSATQIHEGDKSCQSDYLFLGNGHSPTTSIKRTQRVHINSSRISMNSRITIAEYTFW